MIEHTLTQKFIHLSNTLLGVLSLDESDKEAMYDAAVILLEEIGKSFPLSNRRNPMTTSTDGRLCTKGGDTTTSSQYSTGPAHIEEKVTPRSIVAWRTKAERGKTIITDHALEPFSIQKHEAQLHKKAKAPDRRERMARLAERQGFPTGSAGYLELMGMTDPTAAAPHPTPTNATSTVAASSQCTADNPVAPTISQYNLATSTSKPVSLSSQHTPISSQNEHRAVGIPGPIQSTSSPHAPTGSFKDHRNPTMYASQTQPVQTQPVQTTLSVALQQTKKRTRSLKPAGKTIFLDITDAEMLIRQKLILESLLALRKLREGPEQPVESTPPLMPDGNTYINTPDVRFSKADSGNHPAADTETEKNLMTKAQANAVVNFFFTKMFGQATVARVCSVIKTYQNKKPNEGMKIYGKASKAAASEQNERHRHMYQLIAESVLLGSESNAEYRRLLQFGAAGRAARLFESILKDLHNDNAKMHKDHTSPNATSEKVGMNKPWATSKVKGTLQNHMAKTLGIKADDLRALLTTGRAVAAMRAIFGEGIYILLPKGVNKTFSKYNLPETKRILEVVQHHLPELKPLLDTMHRRIVRPLLENGNLTYSVSENAGEADYIEDLLGKEIWVKKTEDGDEKPKKRRYSVASDDDIGAIAGYIEEESVLSDRAMYDDDTDLEDIATERQPRITRGMKRKMADSHGEELEDERLRQQKIVRLRQEEGLVYEEESEYEDPPDRVKEDEAGCDAENNSMLLDIANSVGMHDQHQEASHSDLPASHRRTRDTDVVTPTTAGTIPPSEDTEKGNHGRRETTSGLLQSSPANSIGGHTEHEYLSNAELQTPVFDVRTDGGKKDESVATQLREQ